MTTSPSKPPPKQAIKSPTRPKAKAINQLFHRKLEGKKLNRPALNNPRKPKIQTSLKESVKVKKEQLQELGHVTPEKKNVNTAGSRVKDLTSTAEKNPKLIINEHTVILMLANKSRDEIKASEGEEMKKMLTCYRKARDTGTTRGITKMSRQTLIHELMEAMTIEQQGEFNYVKPQDQDEVLFEKEVGTKSGRIANIPYDATDMDLIYLSNMDLLTYLHYKRISFGESSNFDNSRDMVRDQIVPLVKKYAAIMDPDIKMEDTQTFLLTTNPDDWDDLPIKQIQQHALNWYKFSKAPKNLMETNPEYIHAELNSAQKLLQADPKLKMHDEEASVDSTPEESNMEIEENMNQPPGNASPPEPTQKIPTLTKSLKNGEINQMNRETAERVYTNYLRSKEYHEDAEKVSDLAEGALKNDIIMVRDELYRRSKLLPTLMENPSQRKIDLMPDVPEINLELTDDDLACMTNEELSKLLYKDLKKDGYTQKISTYLQWSDDALRRAIKKRRNDLQHGNKLKSALKPPSKKSATKSTTQSTLAGSVVNTWRYSIGYDLPPDKKGTSGLREYLIYIFKEMQTYEKGTCLLPWTTEDNLKAIKNPEDLPKTITQLKTYFNNARPMNNGGKGYAKIRIGLPVTADRPTFETDFQEWAKGKNVRFYECTVQHHNTKSCGWLVYGPKSLNKKKWSEAVTKLYTATHTNVPGATISLGISWRALNGQRDTDQRQKTYAMHVEAPADQCIQVKRYLRILSRKKIWPLGVKFRLMNEYHIHMKDTNQEKYRYMVNKHKAYQDKICEGQCYQIIKLDKKIKNVGKSIREIVTNIRDRQDNKRIFGSIDEHWRNPLEFTVTYRPDKQSQAYSYLKSLATYVQYLYPNASLNGYFTNEALHKAMVETYDAVAQSFETQEDIEMMEEVKSNMDDDSLDFLDINEDDMKAIRLEIAANHPIFSESTEKIIDVNGEDETQTVISTYDFMSVQSNTITLNHVGG